MKVIAATLAIALLGVTHASILPLGLHPLSAPATIIQSNLGLPSFPAAFALGPYASPAIAFAHGLPAAVPITLTSYAPIAAAAPLATGPASYLAANRGSIHTAPLPGHLISQKSLNLAPAPGTL